jgi:hypothetical protein
VGWGGVGWGGVGWGGWGGVGEEGRSGAQPCAHTQHALLTHTQGLHDGHSAQYTSAGPPGARAALSLRPPPPEATSSHTVSTAGEDGAGCLPPDTLDPFCAARTRSMYHEGRSRQAPHHAAATHTPFPAVHQPHRRHGPNAAVGHEGRPLGHGAAAVHGALVRREPVLGQSDDVLAQQKYDPFVGGQLGTYRARTNTVRQTLGGWWAPPRQEHKAREEGQYEHSCVGLPHKRPHLGCAHILCDHTSTTALAATPPPTHHGWRVAAVVLNGHVSAAFHQQQHNGNKLRRVVAGSMVQRRLRKPTAPSPQWEHRMGRSGTHTAPSLHITRGRGRGRARGEP